MAEWSVYIIRCSDGSLYTGITNDLERRVQQHASKQGAKYFRGRRPQALVYVEDGHDRSSASQREAQIKKLTRPAKERLLVSASNAIDAIPMARDIAAS